MPRTCMYFGHNIMDATTYMSFPPTHGDEDNNIPHSGSISRENIFKTFADLLLSAKTLLTNTVSPTRCGKTKKYSTKIVFAKYANA